MARNAQTERTLTSEEQRLIRKLIRQGGTEDMLPRAARAAKMPLEKAQKILKRVHVQEEVRRRQRLIEFEQAKIDAADICRREDEDEKQIRVTEEKIYRQFNKLLEVEAEKLTNGHKLKAEFLKLGLVITGTIRNGKLERLTPPEGGSASIPTMYESTFERAAQAAQPEAAPLYPEEPLPTAAPAADEKSDSVQNVQTPAEPAPGAVFKVAVKRK